MDVLRFSRGNGGAEDYEPTDSEAEYSDGEREVLKEMRERNKRDGDKKQELMAFDESDDEEDDADDGDDAEEAAISDSDIEGDDDAGVPDAKDWGSQARNYYNTDFVDQDYSTYNEQEEEMAKQEEEEAKIIQVRLAKQMKEEDFQLDDIFGSAAPAEGEAAARGEAEDSLPADLAGLTKRERQRLFEKDSPEFAGLKADFEKFTAEEEQLLHPVLSYVRQNQVPLIPALKYAQLYQNISLTYCSNVVFYLLLKAKRVNVRNHPITKRLVQFKKLLGQLTDKYENIVRPQLEALLQRIEDGDQFEVKDIEAPKRKAKLSVMAQYEQDEDVPEKGKLGKRRTEAEEDDESDDDDDEEDAGELAEEDEDIPESERRGITYQIAKNKGLRVHRKKEQRNPRVKHRSKFRKALIRRKGAVRTVRKETQRYGGEISGIKATVSKSVKFKS